MSRFLKKYSYLILILVALVLAGCASSKKNNWIKERRKSGYVSTSRLGKNKYYFSNSYQKKLYRSMKRKR
ncbi:MAG: hypothetical protein R6W67_05655 [Bacteroidales bacterium]